jgi:hypothetical protein
MGSPLNPRQPVSLSACRPWSLFFFNINPLHFKKNCFHKNHKEHSKKQGLKRRGGSNEVCSSLPTITLSEFCVFVCGPPHHTHIITHTCCCCVCVCVCEDNTRQSMCVCVCVDLKSTSAPTVRPTHQLHYYMARIGGGWAL